MDSDMENTAAGKSYRQFNNGPGVAGAVLQTPQLVSQSVSQSVIHFIPLELGT